MSLRTLPFSTRAAPAERVSAQVTVTNGLLTAPHAQSLTSWAARSLDPRISVKVLRGQSSADLSLEVGMPGATAEFALDRPKSVNAQFGSAAWGRRAMDELVKLNDAFVKGRVGEYLTGGSGAISWGGSAVDAAELAQVAAQPLAADRY